MAAPAQTRCSTSCAFWPRRHLARPIVSRLRCRHLSSAATPGWSAAAAVAGGRRGRASVHRVRLYGQVKRQWQASSRIGGGAGGRKASRPMFHCAHCIVAAGECDAGTVSHSHSCAVLITLQHRLLLSAGTFLATDHTAHGGAGLEEVVDLKQALVRECGLSAAVASRCNPSSSSKSPVNLKLTFSGYATATLPTCCVGTCRLPPLSSPPLNGNATIAVGISVLALVRCA
jgi:hypothetical protein